LDTLSVIAIAFGLAMDAFSVAIATGLRLGQATARQTFRLAFHFGLFQFMMPVIGWLAGTTVAGYISAFDHWLALLLLGYVGARMVWASLRGEADSLREDPTRGISLVMLSLATSIDALAVGLSLAFIETPILVPSAVIGIVAAGMTVLGIRIGRRAGDFIGRRVEFVGGLLLVGIGLKIVFDHTFGA
jgi:manganese efflux pump family protein